MNFLQFINERVKVIKTKLTLAVGLNVVGIIEMQEDDFLWFLHIYCLLIKELIFFCKEIYNITVFLHKA